MDDFTKSEKPDWLELESVKPLSEASEITSLSKDTLRRRYHAFVVKLSARRSGMKLRHILEITKGAV